MTTTMESRTTTPHFDAGPASETGYRWEDHLAALLEELSQLQDQLLDVLSRKRQCMAEGNIADMNNLQPVEATLIQQLEGCHRKRAQLLADASEQGLPSDSLRGLATALSPRQRDKLAKEAQAVSSRMRLLQHQSLANWVLAQKALLHLSQMLEIIATGGRLQPTYGRHRGGQDRGALMDQEV